MPTYSRYSSFAIRLSRIDYLDRRLGFPYSRSFFVDHLDQVRIISHSHLHVLDSHLPQAILHHTSASLTRALTWHTIVYQRTALSTKRLRSTCEVSLTYDRLLRGFLQNKPTHTLQDTVTAGIFVVSTTLLHWPEPLHNERFPDR